MTKKKDKVITINLDDMTSTEAAALYLSEGKTMDPVAAEALAEEQTLDFDEMQRAGLRRAMGFDFRVKVRGTKVMVSSKEGPQVRTSCRVKPDEVDAYGNITSQDLIDRLVQACLRLKDKWEAAHVKA